MSEVWLGIFVVSLITAAFYILILNRIIRMFPGAEDLFANLTMIAALFIEILLLPFGGVELKQILLLFQ